MEYLWKSTQLYWCLRKKTLWLKERNGQRWDDFGGKETSVWILYYVDLAAIQNHYSNLKKNLSSLERKKWYIITDYKESGITYSKKVTFELVLLQRCVFMKLFEKMVGFLQYGKKSPFQ